MWVYNGLNMKFNKEKIFSRRVAVILIFTSWLSGILLYFYVLFNRISYSLNDYQKFINYVNGVWLDVSYLIILVSFLGFIFWLISKNSKKYIYLVFIMFLFCLITIIFGFYYSNQRYYPEKLIDNGLNTINLPNTFTSVSDNVYGIRRQTSFYSNPPYGERVWETKVTREHACTIAKKEFLAWSGNEIVKKIYTFGNECFFYGKYEGIKYQVYLSSYKENSSKLILEIKSYPN